ncbi:uncharacterized protein LOC130998571 [Salvia miltiorrhiza]|uniref:uncharacterized protein LOC130998571 n=1 Tax=Salvia miltiorrhiza TaxID=226208 RepID=UPI0025ACFA1F|nr:uncharacterized protein LOC130998571 [Salvia miltiorrhiza]
MERPLELTDWASMRLAKSVDLGLKMSVQPINPTKFEVTSDNKSYVVDLGSHTCTCLVFQFQMIPCPHAAAAIGKVNQNPSSYVNDYFSTATLREIYSGEVMPLPNPEDWCIPEDIASRVVLTPGDVQQSGRPREKRMKSGGSGSSSRRVCSRCHEKGHYQSTCTAVMQLTVQEEVSSSESCVFVIVGICYRICQMLASPKWHLWH